MVRYMNRQIHDGRHKWQFGFHSDMDKGKSFIDRRFTKNNFPVQVKQYTLPPSMASMAAMDAREARDSSDSSDSSDDEAASLELLSHAIPLFKEFLEKTTTQGYFDACPDPSSEAYKERYAKVLRRFIRNLQVKTIAREFHLEPHGLQGTGLIRAFHPIEVERLQ
jgi:hypothetical protein